MFGRSSVPTQRTMHRFKNILYVAEPGSGLTPGLRRGAELARVNDGRLTIAQVAAPPAGAVTGGLGTEVHSLTREVEEGQREELEGWARELEEGGVQVDTRLLRGKPFLVIVQEVLKEGRDLVMKNAEGPSGGFRSRLFGSTDQHLLRKCPCPVWLFNPSQGPGFRSVLASVDVGGGGDSEINRRILQLASSLSVRENASLHVAHVWSLYGESILRSPSRGVGQDLLNQLLEEEEEERLRRLQSLVEEAAVPDSNPRLHLVKAEAADGIRAVSEEVLADVVVMGTLSRAGVRGLLIGNTAETVLGRLDSSVLAVKPEGFRSPVFPAGAEDPE